MALGDNKLQQRADSMPEPRKSGLSRLFGMIPRSSLLVILLIALVLPTWFLGCRHDSLNTTTFVKPDGHVLLLEEVGGTQGLYDAPFCPKCRALREQEISQVLRQALDTFSVNVVIDEVEEEEENQHGLNE